VAIATFAPEPIGLMRNDKYGLCPRETTCAEEWYTLLLLAISRLSAYMTYPLMILLFISKTNHLRTLAQRSFASLYVPFHDLHHLHVLSGKVVGVSAGAHAAAHFVRWATQGNLHLLWDHVTGRSGLISILCTPLIVLPMTVPSLRSRISWEVRKGLHYLSIVWGVAILFHAPKQHIAYIMGVPVVLYCADYLVGAFWRTYHVPSPTLTHIQCGVEMTFEHPPGFTTDGTGYILVCFPWVSNSQWHAFSLFAHPTLANHSCVCMSKVGDWTNELHAVVQKPTSRPAWVSGPFASPFATAVQFDNLVLVASGIGITPAMSIITTFQQSGRRTNLIWACRDPSLLEFYLQKCKFDVRAWTLIYYTGKRKLCIGCELPPTVLIFNGRPSLDVAVRNMILGVELETGLPEELYAHAEAAISDARDHYNHIALREGLSPQQRFDLLIQRSLITFGETDFVRRLEGQVAGEAELDATKLCAALNALFVEGAFELEEMPALVERFDAGGKGVASVVDLLAYCTKSAHRHALGEEESPKDLSHRREIGRAIRTFMPEKGTKPPSTDALALTKSSTLSLLREQSNHHRFEYTHRDSLAQGDPDSFVKLVGADRLATWQVLYCGGSQPVVDSLKAVERSYGIKLRVEKFDW